MDGVIVPKILLGTDGIEHSDDVSRYALYAEYGGGFCRMILMNPLEERSILPFKGCLIGKWYSIVNEHTIEEDYLPVDKDVIETEIISDIKKVGGLKICCKLKVPVIYFSESSTYFPKSVTESEGCGVGNVLYSPIIGRIELLEEHAQPALLPDRFYSAYASLMSFNRPILDEEFPTQWVLTNTCVSELWDFEKDSYVNKIWKKERGVIVWINDLSMAILDRNEKLLFAKVGHSEVSGINLGDVVEFRAMDINCFKQQMKLALCCRVIKSNKEKKIFSLGNDTFDVHLQYDQEMMRTNVFRIPGIGNLNDPKNILVKVVSLIGRHYYIRAKLTLDFSTQLVKWDVVSTVEKAKVETYNNYLGISTNIVTNSKASSIVVQKGPSRPVNMSHFAPMSSSSSHSSTVAKKDSTVSSAASKNSSQLYKFTNKPSELTLSKIKTTRYQSLAVLLTNKTQKASWLLYSEKEARFVRICKAEINKKSRPGEWYKVEYSEYVNTMEYIFFWSQEQLLDVPLPTRLVDGIAQFQVRAKKEYSQKGIVGDKNPLECYSCQLGTLWISDIEGVGHKLISVWCHPDLQKVTNLVVIEANCGVNVNATQRPSTSRYVEEATTSTSDEEFSERVGCNGSLEYCPSPTPQSVYTSNSDSTVNSSTIDIDSLERDSSAHEGTSLVNVVVREKSSNYTTTSENRNKSLAVHWYSNPVQASMLLFNHVAGRFTRTCFVSNECLPFKPTLGNWYLIEYDRPDQPAIRCPSKHHIFIHRMQKTKGLEPIKTRVIECCAQFLVSAQRNTDISSSRDSFSSCLGPLEIPPELDAQKRSTLSVWCRPAREFFTRSMKFSVEEVTTDSIVQPLEYPKNNMSFQPLLRSVVTVKSTSQMPTHEIENTLGSVKEDLKISSGNNTAPSTSSKLAVDHGEVKLIKTKVVAKSTATRGVTTIATFDEEIQQPQNKTSFFKRLFQPFLPRHNENIEIASDICDSVSESTDPVERPNVINRESECNTPVSPRQAIVRSVDTYSSYVPSEDSVSLVDRPKITVGQRLIQQNSSSFPTKVLIESPSRRSEVKSNVSEETVDSRRNLSGRSYRKSKAVYFLEKGDEIRWLFYDEKLGKFTHIKQSKKKLQVNVSRGCWYEIEFEVCENSPWKLHIRIHAIEQTSACVQTQLSEDEVQFLMGTQAQISGCKLQILRTNAGVDVQDTNNKFWCKLKDPRGFIVEFVVVDQLKRRA